MRQSMLPISFSNRRCCPSAELATVKGHTRFVFFKINYSRAKSREGNARLITIQQTEGVNEALLAVPRYSDWSGTGTLQRLVRYRLVYLKRLIVLTCLEHTPSRYVGRLSDEGQACDLPGETWRGQPLRACMQDTG